MTTLLLVTLGSSLGAPARYLLDRFIQARHDRVFPWGTWTINVTGSFLLGLLAGTVAQLGLDPRLLAAIGTGLLGSYTTFSTFTPAGPSLPGAARGLAVLQHRQSAS